MESSFVSGFVCRSAIAVAPSSSSLARAITQGLGPDSGPILELGPGTGVFTRCLIDRGVSRQSITAVEIGEAFADRLRRDLPGVNVQAGSTT